MAAERGRTRFAGIFHVEAPVFIEYQAARAPAENRELHRVGVTGKRQVYVGVLGDGLVPVRGVMRHEYPEAASCIRHGLVKVAV